jgi:hypothetical protein
MNKKDDVVIKPNTLTLEPFKKVNTIDDIMSKKTNRKED